jgi:hypothetical protein
MNLQETVAKKRALCESVADEIGLPRWAITPLDGGLAYKHSREEVRDYLRSIKEHLQAVHILPDDPPRNAKEFASAIKGDVVLNEKEREEFHQALGIPSRRAKKESAGESFTKGILE